MRLTGVDRGSNGSISTTQPNLLVRSHSIGVEARVSRVPTEAAVGGRDPVTLFQRASRIGCDRSEEEAVEVLLAREVGAPGREAHRAIVQRAQDPVPVGSSIVFNRSSPAAGPPIFIGVWPVMRRAKRD